jgi:hypothetical protein
VFGLRTSLEGNPAPEDDWGEVDFATWAAGEERFAEHFGPVENGGGLPIGEWLALPEAERAGRVPIVAVGERRLAVGERVARAAAERSAVWRTLRELSGGLSPFTEKIRAAIAEELDAQRIAELEAQKAEYEARLAEARAGVDRDAIERLTTRLMALSGFGSERAKEGGAS